MVSIIILTKNEALDLSSCLDSVQWSNDIHILDSGSTDETLDIAQDYNAAISINPFESFSRQRNFALDNLEVKNEWILFLDADEITTEKFRSSIFEAIQHADKNLAGYYCCWRMMLEGRWLKYCDNFPKWQFRLLRKGRARFKDVGHGQKETEVIGDIGYITEPYLHYAFSKGWYNWIDRHNKYSSQEAIERLNNRTPLKYVLSKDQSIRNPALKFYLSRLPGWPVLRFVYTYIFQLGFLEGVPGLIYCINMGYYEFLIQIKMRQEKKKLNPNRVKP